MRTAHGRRCQWTRPRPEGAFVIRLRPPRDVGADGTCRRQHVQQQCRRPVDLWGITAEGPGTGCTPSTRAGPEARRPRFRDRLHRAFLPGATISSTPRFHDIPDIDRAVVLRSRSDWGRRVKDAGLHLICQVQTFADVDLLRARGRRRRVGRRRPAGHTGTMTLLPLLCGIAEQRPDVPLLRGGRHRRRCEVWRLRSSPAPTDVARNCVPRDTGSRGDRRRPQERNRRE